MRIAVLDHQAEQALSHAMAGFGHECHPYTEGRMLLQALRRQTFDLLVLDWRLPDIPAVDVVKTVRNELRNRLPILFVAGQRERANAVEGLNAGADDFMTNPVQANELEARVNALLRRSYPASHEAELVFGDFHFYPQARTVKLHGAKIDLKSREYDLALFLFQNLGRMLSREHLHESVWGGTTEVQSRSLDTHVSRLRTKMGLRAESGFLLLAIYGMGYRLEAVENYPYTP